MRHTGCGRVVFTVLPGKTVKATNRLCWARLKDGTFLPFLADRCVRAFYTLSVRKCVKWPETRKVQNVPFCLGPIAMSPAKAAGHSGISAGNPGMAASYGDSFGEISRFDCFAMQNSQKSAKNGTFDPPSAKYSETYKIRTFEIGASKMSKRVFLQLSGESYKNTARRASSAIKNGLALLPKDGNSH